ncbi:MAG: DUF4230 domain-containing protein [Candidatus Ornithospirochaeta sp.]
MDNDKQNFDICKLSDGEYNLTVKDHSLINGPNLINKRNRLTIVLCCIVGLAIILASFFLIITIGKGPKTTVSTTINYKAIQEKAELTVLSICVNKTINENKSDNNKGITASTTFSGKGTYTVDLSRSEFLVDNVRQVLVIKTPSVKLDQDHFTLEYNNIKQNFFNNSFSNNSYKDGVAIAVKQFKEAYNSIYKTIASNPYFYSNAVSAAEKLIESYAKNINKDIQDLTVIVEVGAI